MARRPAAPQAIVIFGASGDLTKRKLLPAFFHLYLEGMLPERFAIVGYARTVFTDEEFREHARESVMEHGKREPVGEVWMDFAKHLRYVPGEFSDPGAMSHVTEDLEDIDAVHGTEGNRFFYCATPPDAYPDIVKRIGESGLQVGAKIVFEKPFGRDLASARALNQCIHGVFDESQVFRIDHYLGKETVQNMMALRFANQLFEPIWNAHFVDHVQITMAEDVGIESRAGYYDGIGAARDVIQNHLMQLLALVGMEEPVSFDARDLRAEKKKVLSAVRLPPDLARHTARGQYIAGWAGGVKVPGYLQEEGIPADSRTETYAAVRLDIDTRRWAGVPFYLRTGKRLGRRVTEVAVVFQRAPHLPFESTATEELGENALVVRVQPDEGVTMRFGSKVPGTAMEVRDVTMDFGYGHSFTEDSPEAYERLILDVLLGDPPLFPRHEEVELSWQILDPIERYWARYGQPEQYRSGSWGPASATEMLARDGRVWRRP